MHNGHARVTHGRDEPRQPIELHRLHEREPEVVAVQHTESDHEVSVRDGARAFFTVASGVARHRERDATVAILIPVRAGAHESLECHATTELRAPRRPGVPSDNLGRSLHHILHVFQVVSRILIRFESVAMPCSSTPSWREHYHIYHITLATTPSIASSEDAQGIRPPACRTPPGSRGCLFLTTRMRRTGHTAKGV